MEPVVQSQKTSEAVRESIDTIVIGGSQSGLSISYYLTQEKRPHVVLEQDHVGSTWLSERWDSFTLVTPNWMNQLPGFPYQGADPDGFLAREEVIKYLRDYASSFNSPVKTGVRAECLKRKQDDSGFLVETNREVYQAQNIVVATGFFNQSKIPGFASDLPKWIDQIHSSEYRNPDHLRPGAVLVVGSAQSGCQIAEELQECGRKVYLSVGNAARQPRRYRGKDICYWVAKMGIYDRPFKDPTNPTERYQANPHCSGKNGGHALNLEKFAATGMTLLGHIVGVKGARLEIAPDLAERVRQADEFSKMLTKAVDAYIEEAGLEVPEANNENTDDGSPRVLPVIKETVGLDLAESGITSIIWATGYSCDFSWIDLPILDDRRYPIQNRGISNVPGLYFCGLHWMHSLKSGLIFGVGDDALHVVRHLVHNR